mmetsp:Transcript_10342/g.23261  ORF Transcript_10342/g.23261 Transcript_10342/m.23261 type:complete len:240 (+) Transcript_10342:378-1097(+)
MPVHLWQAHVQTDRDSERVRRRRLRLHHVSQGLRSLLFLTVRLGNVEDGVVLVPTGLHSFWLFLVSEELGQAWSVGVRIGIRALRRIDVFAELRPSRRIAVAAGLCARRVGIVAQELCAHGRRAVGPGHHSHGSNIVGAQLRAPGLLLGRFGFRPSRLFHFPAGFLPAWRSAFCRGLGASWFLPVFERDDAPRLCYVCYGFPASRSLSVYAGFHALRRSRERLQSGSVRYGRHLHEVQL